MHIQVLTGLERHGVRACDVDVQPIVEALVQGGGGQRARLPGVLASLRAMGYAK